MDDSWVTENLMMLSNSPRKSIISSNKKNVSGTSRNLGEKFGSFTKKQ